MKKNLTAWLMIPCLSAFFMVSGQVKAESVMGNDSGSVVMELLEDREQSLFSFRLGENLYYSADLIRENEKWILPGKAEIKYIHLSGDEGQWLNLTIRNISSDTFSLHNLVPFSENPDRVYITGSGNHPLSRSYLFRPGYEPVNVILPDNAWELGFGISAMKNGSQVCALFRRKRESLEKGQVKRFETILFPGGKIEYIFRAESYSGEWQEGLRKIFHEKMLYDVPASEFDNSLYERTDLNWIRHSYVSHLIQAWDNYFYDYSTGRFMLEDFYKKGLKLYGGDDFIGIWPTWPSLGLDQRNQWDMFRDLPGGTAGLKKQSEMLESHGSALFICYNPWDESTRKEDHHEGMAEIIRQTWAKGVVLDTRGESDRELQEAADRVRNGVIMYSEGMAVPRNMEGIVAGRVHNALYHCPLLNLNKLIKPEFAIFRVTELYREPVKREFCHAFFNGYGTELNIFAPGKPEWLEEQYIYLGKTSRILRENTDNFTQGIFTPLIPTIHDSIWVNRWYLPEKTIYTICSNIPQGFRACLFEAEPCEDIHYVDIWHHKELLPVRVGEKWMLEAESDAFSIKWAGTNNEWEADCIAGFPVLISGETEGDLLKIKSIGGDSIRVWAGKPSYQKKALVLPSGSHEIRLMNFFGRFEGKFVIQLFNRGILLDEIVRFIPAGTPRMTSVTVKTGPADKKPEGMALIPGGNFIFRSTHGDNFIPYPVDKENKSFEMHSFYMDIFPVTNREFKDFLEKSGYIPSDSVNFLKNWKNGCYKPGEENFPVVYVSLEDAKAFARWSGKRLPDEIEWQYAAQTSSGNEWPWKQKNPVTREEEVITASLKVSRIKGLDKGMCNPGDGKLYAVGSFPGGVNPNGLQDLTGCVWQLTNDEYASGSYRYIILKGGSCFNPSSSWWYVQGGPRELHYRQQLLRVSQGFERNATVGFRCVKDL